MSDQQLQWNYVFAAWLVAAIASLGALFLGEVMKLPTCDLCWYQRIFMFPLAIILAVGLFPLDLKVTRYAVPLALIGWLVAAYHQLIVFGMIPETLRPCSQDVPCGTTVITWFGFLTIPWLSLAAFSAIIFLLMRSNRISPS